MDMLKVILPCLNRRTSTTTTLHPTTFHNEKAGRYTSLSEKTPSYPPKHEQLTTQETALSVLSVLQNADKPGCNLDATIHNIVHQAGGWRESIAAAILSTLETALKAGSQMNQVMKEAYDKACEAAAEIEGLARDHPVYCTVIALGVLAFLAPYVLEALGFAALGPVEGSWAAAWQALYKGYVPARSLFAFLQRLADDYPEEYPSEACN